MAYKRYRRYRGKRSYASRPRHERHRDSAGDVALYGLMKNWEAGAHIGRGLYRAGRFGARVASLPFKVGRGIYRTFKR